MCHATISTVVNSRELEPLKRYNDVLEGRCHSRKTTPDLCFTISISLQTFVIFVKFLPFGLFDFVEKRYFLY